MTVLRVVVLVGVSVAACVAAAFLLARALYGDLG